MKKLALLLFTTCISCGKVPKDPPINHEIGSQVNKSLPSVNCEVILDNQILDQFVWMTPFRPAAIKLLRYRIKNKEQTFAFKISESSIYDGWVKILYRKTRKEDFRNNTFENIRKFKSAVLNAGISEEIYLSTEIIYCTFNNS